MSEAVVLARPAKVSTFSPLLWTAVAVGLVVLCVAPLGISAYWLRVLTSVLMYVIITQGLNVIVGITGYHAFGNGVFFGVGAYACGACMAAGMPFAVGVAGAIAISAACALFLGWPILRLRGHYFAIATVALNLAAVQIIIQIGGITGGAQGLALPLSTWEPKPLYVAIYYLMLAGAVVCTAIVALLLKLPLGYALRAIGSGLIPGFGSVEMRRSRAGGVHGLASFARCLSPSWSPCCSLARRSPSSSTHRASKAARSPRRRLRSLSPPSGSPPCWSRHV